MNKISIKTEEPQFEIRCGCSPYAQEVLTEDDITTLIHYHLPIALNRLGDNSGLYEFSYDSPESISCVVLVLRGSSDRANFSFGSHDECEVQWDVWRIVLSELGSEEAC